MADAQKIPLVVDLDGTLLRTDTLWESLAILLRREPPAILKVVFWQLRGRAFLKQKLAASTRINPASLPYNKEFLAWLRAEKQNGRKLILATVADLKVAQAVADHTGLFDEVLASDGKTNLHGQNKLRVLVQKFGERGFDYAGNSAADFAVWRGARAAVVVNATPGVEKKAADCARIDRVFEPATPPFRPFFRCLRPHQWAKNLIIFVPIIAGHKMTDPTTLLNGFFAFVVFCVCASGVYVVNDLMDLDDDRDHPTKRRRPLASGDLPLAAGLVAGPLLLAAGLLAAVELSWLFAGVVALYLVLTTAYSWRIKRVVLLDVFFLAGLYTIRLVAGHATTGIIYSAWLLMFSMFIFLSLALVKRYVELAAAKEVSPENARVGGRGYEQGDLELVTSLGTGSGFIAALVMALYVDSQQVVVLYAHPKLLLLACPLLLYWISRIWLLAHRRQLHEDPVLFAIKDVVSYVIGALVLGVLWLASGH
ncbi:MAG TPA: UbiA family prenyltransferase [Candidatus Acidoferrales bacterium]|nr:UbiA family prenyltransferase [Candidatus Acidoferrales bacterium]